jgi:F0F1-type ATP synthase assembly protein I
MPQSSDDRDDRSDSAPGPNDAGKRGGSGDTQHANLAMVGLQVAIGVGLGLVVGTWLDKRFGWAPWGSTIGAMIGLAGGLYLLIKEAIRINKD